MSIPRKVLLTPLVIVDDDGYFVCIAIRDPQTQEIIDKAVTSDALAEKAGIPLEQARRIFQAAQEAADKRAADSGEGVSD